MSNTIVVPFIGLPGAQSIVPGPVGQVGPTGPDGIIGSAVRGAWTPVNDGVDWVSVPAGTANFVVYSLPNGSVAVGEIVVLRAEVVIEQDGGNAFDLYVREIVVRNIAGALQTPSGGALDFDLTGTDHSTGPIAGVVPRITIVGAQLSIELTSPGGVALQVGVAAWINRRLLPGTQVAPITSSLSVAGGPNTGGTLGQAHGLRFALPNLVNAFSLAGIALASGNGTDVGTFHVDSDTQISFCAPPSATVGAGPALATSSAGGTSTVNWTYTQGTVPITQSTSVSSGLSSGTTAVVLGGVHYSLPLPAIGVTFAGVAGIIDSIDSDGQIHARATSTSQAGVGDILVSSAAGGVALAGAWTYIGPPTLTAMTVDIANKAGGTTVSGTGTSLFGLTQVLFDGIAGTNLVVGGNGTTWQCTAPAMTGPHASVNGGYVSVQATNAAGVSNTLTGTAGLYYLPRTATLFHNPANGALFTPPNPTNGTLISAEVDASGNANNMQQNTAAMTPGFVSAVAMATPAPGLQFSQTGGAGGVAQWMQGTLAAPVTTTTLTMLVVFVAQTGSATAPIMELDTGGVYQSSGCVFVNRANNGNTTCRIGTGSGSTLLGNNVSSLQGPGVPSCVSTRFDGGNNYVRNNGVDSPAVAYSTPFTGLTRYSLGNAWGTNAINPLQMVFGLISTDAWTTADFTSFSTYTNHKWGLAAA